MIFPAGEHVDVTQAIAVDYDDRDLRDAAPSGAVYRLPSAPIKSATYWKQVQRDLADHLARSLTMELPVNRELKLYGRAGESAEDFALRCRTVAGERADAELTKLRAKYETKTAALRNRLEAATDAAQVAGTSRTPAPATTCCRRPARSSAACWAAADRRAGWSARSAGPPAGRARPRPPHHESKRPRTRRPGWRTTCEDLEASWSTS